MKLELSHKQKQVLSQRMQISSNILQMNAFDLERFIFENALENPVIELDAPTTSDALEQSRLRKLEWLESIEDSGTNHYVPKQDDDDNDVLYEKETSESLTDELLEQLPVFNLCNEDERLVRYLIGSLDENGYLAVTREQLLKGMETNEAGLDSALETLRRMEPSGVGAFDLSECLMIQAQRNPHTSPVMLDLIKYHLDALAKNQITKLAKTMHVPVEEIKKARDQLLTFNPKPGNGYTSHQVIPYIRPDIFIVRFENGFQIILNDYGQPKIEINGYYRELAKDTESDAAEYVNAQLGKAEWLVSCIRQRNNTILACADSILKRQQRFFRHGTGNRVPMTLADVAGDVGLHPSTVSRAVRGKYLQCQWGVFGLGDFFSRQVSHTDGGETQSQDAILLMIKRIIAEENQGAPKSDQDIADELCECGVNIARRTVAKYRTQAGLPPANVRKEF